MTPARTPEELDALVERLDAVETCVTGQHFADGTLENDRWLAEFAAATITDLRARIAELEADKAQWVEIERMQLGIQGEG